MMTTYHSFPIAKTVLILPFPPRRYQTVLLHLQQPTRIPPLTQMLLLCLGIHLPNNTSCTTQTMFLNLSNNHLNLLFFPGIVNVYKLCIPSPLPDPMPLETRFIYLLRESQEYLRLYLHLMFTPLRSTMYLRLSTAFKHRSTLTPIDLNAQFHVLTIGF